MKTPSPILAGSPLRRLPAAQQPPRAPAKPRTLFARNVDQFDSGDDSSATDSDEEAMQIIQAAVSQSLLVK